MKTEQIYRVAFQEAPFEDSEKKEFFFTSLAAIYDIFTPEQIGCKVAQLWRLRISSGTPYNGRHCRITREEIHRKKRKRKIRRSRRVFRDE